jgi:hypothetical protein
MNAFMLKIIQAEAGQGEAVAGVEPAIVDGPHGVGRMTDQYVGARTVAEHLVAEANSTLGGGVPRFEVVDLPSLYDDIEDLPRELGFVLKRGGWSVQWRLLVENSQARVEVSGLPRWASGEVPAAFGDIESMEDLLVALTRATGHPEPHTRGGSEEAAAWAN